MENKKEISNINGKNKITDIIINIHFIIVNNKEVLSF